MLDWTLCSGKTRKFHLTFVTYLKILCPVQVKFDGSQYIHTYSGNVSQYFIPNLPTFLCLKNLK